MAKYKQWLKPENLALLEAWTKDALSSTEIAEKCGISERTLCNWKSKYPEIEAALRRDDAQDDIVDSEVENALLRRALGFTYVETTTEETPSGPKKRESIKFVPPDLSAQIFWLNNRKPNLWRNRKDIDERPEEAVTIVINPREDEPKDNSPPEEQREPKDN